MYKFFLKHRWKLWVFALASAGALWYFKDFYFEDFKFNVLAGKNTIPLEWFNQYKADTFYVLAALGIVIPIVFPPKKDKRVKLNFMGLEIPLDFIFRGTLITGETGSGKTASAIARLLYQFFRKIPDFGALCLDMKGNFFHTVEKFAKAAGQSAKIVTLQVRPDVIRIRLRSDIKDSATRDLMVKISAVLQQDIREKVKKDSISKDWLPENMSPEALKKTVTCIADGIEYSILVDYPFHDAVSVGNLIVDGKKIEDLPEVKIIGYIPSKDWQPTYRYNPLSYEGIPIPTYAKMIIDTGKSFSGGGNKGSDYFIQQAEIHIKQALFLLESISWIRKKLPNSKYEKTLFDDKTKAAGNLFGYTDKELWMKMPNFISFQNLAKFFLNGWLDAKYIKFLDRVLIQPSSSELRKFPDKHEKLKEELQHFTLLLNKGKEEMSGVIGTIQNFLAFFLDEDLNDIFSAEENSFEFGEIDKGKIFSVSIPQRYQRERQFINTFFKMIYYTHCQMRFGRQDTLKNKNPLFLIMDEAQGGVTSSGGGGTADYNVIDKIREARCSVIFATQSTSSFDPVLDASDKDALLLNLANQFHFTAADDKCAEYIAKKIGKKETFKKSTSTGKGGKSVSKSKEEVFKIKEHELRSFKTFECVIISAEKKWKRGRMAPITPEGKTPAYYHDLV